MPKIDSSHAAQNDRYDAIVMGGGIIGAVSTYELARQGARVLLLDKFPFLTGASAYSAAMIESQLDHHRGHPFVSLATASAALFPQLHKDIREETSIDFEYEVCGILQLALNTDEVTSLKQQVTVQKQEGHKIEWLEPSEIKKRFPTLSLKNLGGVFFAEDGQVNGGKFLEGALKAAQKLGAGLHDNVGDIEFCLKDARIDGIKTKLGTFQATTYVATAGAWTDQLLNSLGLKFGIEPVRGQLVLYDVPGDTFPFPVYTKKDGYITPKRDGTTLAGTTVESVGFENTTTESGRQKIVTHAELLVAEIKNFPIRKMTAGLRPRPSGDLPIIGPSKKFNNLIVAAGHYRNGVLLAPITAKIVAALAFGQKPPVDITSFLPNS